MSRRRLDTGFRFGQDHALSLGKANRRGGLVCRGFRRTRAAAIRISRLLMRTGVPRRAVGCSPSEIAQWFVVEDAPIVEIGQQCTTGDNRRDRRLIVRYLTVLARHDQEVDQANGRDVTPKHQRGCSGSCRGLRPTQRSRLIERARQPAGVGWFPYR
jgi:hypothetical protein